jgi:hypothetical protein
MHHALPQRFDGNRFAVSLDDFALKHMQRRVDGHTNRKVQVGPRVHFHTECDKSRWFGREQRIFGRRQVARPTAFLALFPSFFRRLFGHLSSDSSISSPNLNLKFTNHKEGMEKEEEKRKKKTPHTNTVSKNENGLVFPMHKPVHQRS